MSDLDLREATSADAPVLVEIIRAAFDEYRERLDPPSGALRQSVEEIRASMETARYVLALVENEAVGCVMYEARGDHMYLGRLAVLPAFRGRGIARALMEFVEERAGETGMPRVRLGVRVALASLRAAYDRHGYQFHAYHNHEGYSEPTYVILEKELNGGAQSPE